MKLEFTPYVLPFVISSVILIYLSVYAFRLRIQVEFAGLFSMVALSLAIWTACYALELSSVSLESKIFWAKMKYFGSTPGPVLWFIFSLHYTHHRNWLTTPVKILLVVFIFLTIGIVFTNEWHRWYWTEIFLITGFPETQSEHGFFFWVYAAGIYLLILASVINYANYYRIVPILFRRQALLMVLGGFVPLGIRILEDFVGWDPFPKIDNVILFLLLSAILFAIALFRFGALEIVPIAHNLIVQYVNYGILVLDALGRVVEINPFARKIIGSESEDSIGKSLDSVLKDWPEIDYSPQMKERREQEISINKEGHTLFFIVQVSPIRNERREFIGHVIVLVDIADRKKAEMELERLARTDVLTDVTNRRHFFELAELEFERFKRYGHPLAIMMLDIDHFKQINDTHGHLAGDFVIRSVAAECSKYLRTTDIFARYGGEEFICLLYEVDPEEARETAERIRTFIEDTSVKFDGKSIHVTASFGLAFAEMHQTLEKVIDLADQCLYKSKTDGRNRVTIWQS
jgi:diguanylate cyclase (GGDEF)-like protein/PAS domain S-box-containing protein